MVHASVHPYLSAAVLRLLVVVVVLVVLLLVAYLKLRRRLCYTPDLDHAFKNVQGISNQTPNLKRSAVAVTSVITNESGK